MTPVLEPSPCRTKTNDPQSISHRRGAAPWEGTSTGVCVFVVVAIVELRNSGLFSVGGENETPTASLVANDRKIVLVFDKAVDIENVGSGEQFHQVPGERI